MGEGALTPHCAHVHADGKLGKHAWMTSLVRLQNLTFLVDPVYKL